MADANYCLWIFGGPCLKPEVWAAWAQAVFAGVAIFAVGFIPAFQQKARDRKTRADYARLLEIASAATQKHMAELSRNKYDASGNRYAEELSGFSPGIVSAFKFVRFDQLPDYALLEPLSDALHAVENFESAWRQMKSDSQCRTLAQVSHDRYFSSLERARDVLQYCAVKIQSFR